ncbi:MAG: hypothetical protein NZ700_14605 [Gemmataceae bacterium]|nr:hypothetical protein [Gemmataceae bacterium]MDW8264722.1 hypothetical protein [Gemmataceae bacterium]
MSRRNLWRAPSVHGGILADPPLEEVGGLLESNRRCLGGGAEVSILGRPLAEVQRGARAAALAAARAYLQAAGDAIPNRAGADRLLVTGHQPELFHPGVWIKNFVLHALARRHGLTPLFLIADHDTLKSPSLLVPSRNDGAASVRLRRLAFDRGEGEVPWEERGINDPATFATFGERAEALLAAWGVKPLLLAFWTEVRRHTNPRIGERFAGARRCWERAWGCHNWELPISRLAETEPFAWFVCHLITELTRFRQVHNAAIRDYRQRHRVRSRRHPVPELTVEEDWEEAPLWAWQPGASRRGRLFVRRRGPDWELRADAEACPTVRATDPAAWLELVQRGLRIRPRALATTLFARVFLAELFIHGIGGAKYDELTDALIERFYGLGPPIYLVVSATLHLPLPPWPATAAESRRLAALVRDLYYNPQRHLDRTNLPPDVARLVAEKNAWIAQAPTEAAARRQRFHALRAITEALRPAVAERIREARRRLRQCEEELRANAILWRRDFAFCLYPEDTLREFYRPLMAGFEEDGKPAEIP